jgi:ATP-binding protein involved in chromosome partitioning
VSSPAPDALKTALALVIDPELRRNVIELGMVDSVDVDGARVHVTIRLTVPGCPLKSNIEAQVKMHVGAVPGVEHVSIGFTHMDEQQRAALRAQLNGGRSEGGERTIAVEERTRVIAVASGKGGVGKSSLTVNLALALRARGLEVGVVDADIYGYSIPAMLGIQQRPVVVDKMIIPPVAHDLKVMSIGFFLDDGGSVVWRGPMLHRALEQFLSDVYWGPLDYLLIDMPPGTGDVGLSLGQLLPRSEAVLVTTPQLAAQRVASRAAQMVEKLGQPLIGVIENMSSLACPCCGEATYPFGQGGGAELAAQLGVPLLGEVPLEPALREGSDSGAPVFTTDPGAASSRAIAAIAQRIAATGPAPAGPVRISSPLAVLKG